METKYRALRTIATIFKVLGWVMLILGILGACGSSAAVVFGGSTMMGLGGAGRGGSDVSAVYSLVIAVVIFIVTIVTVGLYALLLIAASEGIYVFLDIEANTRQMAKHLSQRGGGAVPPPPGP
jgi:magnesium-transporting ATPase (P-type)